MIKNIEVTLLELEKLKNYIKNYNSGAFSAFYLQISTILTIHDILEMRMKDVYYLDEGIVKVKLQIEYCDGIINLNEAERKELAWYAFQRIPVCKATEDMLEEWLCLNKHKKQLQVQTYRKILERSSWELGFTENYNVSYLRSMYGYLAIACGEKTIDEVAKEYKVTKSYLLNRVFRGEKIMYLDKMVNQVANIAKER